MQGPDSQGDLDYEKEGDSYRELVTLLKDKSPKFAEMIDKQVSNLKNRNLSVHHKTWRHELDNMNDTNIYGTTVCDLLV